ncbi:reverse gyrase [Candidatus Pacearchaeota archaeon ex4484_31]|nr:MAG: reverse gyrase [Candidatus Pacearchaeota archaeon ex4484_31]
MKALFINFCPNCGSNISDERLSKASLCSKCLSKPLATNNYLKIFRELKQKGKIKHYLKLYNFFKEKEKIKRMYEKVLNNKPSALQETWINRVLLGKSFSIVAPTGIGKTVFGLITAIYFASKKKKSYLMFPTSLLVQQAEEKLRKFLKKLNLNINFLAYHSALKQKQKKEVLDAIERNEYNILITTNHFLVKNFEKINQSFDFVFVDDVDSFLKSSKNIDKIIKLLGGNKELLEVGMKKISKEKLNAREEKMLEEVRQKQKLGLLVFSSATAKQRRTKKIRLFRELFGFELGFKPEFLRNIEDIYVEIKDESKKEIKEKVLELVKKLGNGGLIFVPSALGTEFCKELDEWLNKKGIKAWHYEKPDAKIIEEFRKGMFTVLIGIASYKSPLARGLDLPETIRYAIFAGIPRSEISLSIETYNANKLLVLANSLVELIEDKEKRLELEKVIVKLRKIVPLTKEQIEAIEKNEIENSFLKHAKEIVEKAQKVLKNLLSKEFLEKIKQSKEIRLKKDRQGFKLVVADPVGYLQASGRTSRLFVNGISKGLSLVVVDDQKAFYGLKKKLSYYTEEVEFKEFEKGLLEEIIKEVDKDRETIKKALSGKFVKAEKDFVKTTLVIVESPTKARTIARFFGKPSKREINGIEAFEISTGKKILSIVASIGHLLDLSENKGFDGVKIVKEKGKLMFLPVYDSIKKCKVCNEQFVDFNYCPRCKSKEFVDKRKIIEALQNLALEVNEVLIATDPDAEGEKIAWDLALLLKPFNANIKRSEFHEVTRKALKKAFEEARKIDEALVDAQIVRRIEDRWIGFELSKILWKKFRNHNLSAGRVQTPVLGWIIERTSKVREKVKVLKVNVEAYSFTFKDVEIDEAPKKIKVKIETAEKEETVNPLPPFTTDSLLKEASTLLKFPSAKTMQLAQQLFEIGLITYHRTDSTHLSSYAINLAKQWFQDNNKSEIFHPRQYGKEGTHEAIRPTKPIDAKELVRLVYAGILRFPIKLTKEHLQLYDLIFKRFVASQAKKATIVKQKIKASIKINDKSYVDEKEAIIEIKEKGFYEFIKPRIHKPIKPNIYEAETKLYVMPKAKPFMQGDVIALMKEKGIGRPSTYAKIMQTLLERQYVKEIKNFLFSTKKGFKVFNFLNSKYHEYVTETFTRKLESDMDAIEKGKLNYLDVLRNLYKEVRKFAK